MKEKDVTKVIEGLSALLTEVPKKFGSFSEAELSYKPAPGKWSKKEILGHLCDSCLNNMQRIVRVQYEDKPFVIYNQDEWVKNQRYQELLSDKVLELWVVLHRQFIHALKSFPENHLESIIDVGKEVTACFVITDYLDHQHHHLKQLFDS
jgi:hypothetical protein